MKIWTINIIGFADGEEYLEDQRSGFGCWEDANEARRKLFAPGGAYHGFDGYAKIVEEWVPDKGCKLVVQDNEGRDIDFYAAVALMDDEIREDLHNQIAPTTPQKFFDAYSVRHLGKYGEPFFVN